MIGWMIADHQGKKTANLKQVTLTTIDSQKCQSFHEKKLSKSEFCTQVEFGSNYCKVEHIMKNIILTKRNDFLIYFLI